MVVEGDDGSGLAAGAEEVASGTFAGRFGVVSVSEAALSTRCRVRSLGPDIPRGTRDLRSAVAAL